MGGMAPRKPTALLSSMKHNSGRYAGRADEPVIKPITTADPPAYFDTEQRKCWETFIALAHKGTLSASDLLLIEHGAQLLATLRKKNWNVSPAVMTRFEVVLAKLGMTPADRSRVAALKEKTPAQHAAMEFARGNRAA